MSGALMELAVNDLGIIGDLRLLLAPGMTAVTGETGAGKTLIVEAIELLVGGRADPTLVRPGAEEARVEGRFDLDGEELILARAVPRDGRSRAYVNGRLATASTLSEYGERLVDLHGQHAHQSLLEVRAQRATLDRFAAIDLGPYSKLRNRLAEVESELADLGGDERARAREIDLLQHQIGEIDSAAITDVEEDQHLDQEEDELRDAVGHREAAWKAVAALTDDGAAADLVATALSAMDGRMPFAAVTERLRAVSAELVDLAGDIRDIGEQINDDPARLDAVRQRRHLLRDLCRKYGDDLATVLSFREEIGRRLDELTRHDEAAGELERARQDVIDELATVAADIAARRRSAAPELAEAIAARLDALAMPGARVELSVDGPDPADDVSLCISANRGSPPLPLKKIASGGELARTMLAIRLVLTVGPPVLVFDEVDAGIGGEAASAVGRALARVADHHQVLVVTHLPQVAAWADHHVRVAKSDLDSSTTVSTATTLAAVERRTELARMLSGSPDSDIAVDHASELLNEAAEAKKAS